jgi:hypothetical protein
MSERDALSMPEAEVPTVRPERRAWVRYSCHLLSSCRNTEQAEDTFLCTATVADLSIAGVSLIVPRRFEHEMVVAVALWNTRQTFRCPRQARVVRTAALPGNRWLLGCELIPPLGEDEMHKLLS